MDNVDRQDHLVNQDRAVSWNILAPINQYLFVISGEPGRPGVSTKGDAGENGEPGFAGQPGQTGMQGYPGLPGDKGLDGRTIYGPIGDSGVSGRPGASGAPGDRGDSGLQGYSLYNCIHEQPRMYRSKGLSWRRCIAHWASGFARPGRHARRCRPRWHRRHTWHGRRAGHARRRLRQVFGRAQRRAWRPGRPRSAWLFGRAGRARHERLSRQSTGTKGQTWTERTTRKYCE